MVTGSLQIKSGTYYAVVRVPDAIGRQKQKWISTGIKANGNNKRQANARLREIIVELEQQKTVYSSSTLFLDWIDRWMEQKKNEVRLNTFESYELYITAHLAPFFKPLKLKLSAVTPQHVQDYYNEKKKAGLSADTIIKHNVIIRGALQDAMKKNLIPYNPAERATLPTKTKYMSKAYSIEQANALLEVIEEEPMKPAVILGLFYGLRRSEALGLRWRDIDFEKGTIRICNTVVKTRTLIESEQTKSRASNRTLYIIPETKEYLLSIKRRQAENRVLMGSEYHNSDHVCTWEDGRAFNPNYITLRFGRILKKHGLQHIRYHELRHTAGSLLLERGLSAKQIQEYLGHEKIATTLDIYGHLSIEGKKEAADTMGRLLKLGIV